MKASMTHLNEDGHVHIVNISGKESQFRRAIAETWVSMTEACFRALSTGNTPKGDVFATVRLAAIMATKKTSDLIPLCHPLALESVTCEIFLSKPDCRVRIEVSAATTGKTGVEMEALTGASVAALTLYDMLKALDKSMVIGPTQLLSKAGGKSGAYVRSGD